MRFARALLRDEQAAEDAVQEGFLRVMRSGSSFQSTSALRLYLVRSVRSAAVDMLRKKSPAPDAVTPPISGPPEYVLDMLSALPDEQKEVVVMRIWGGMKFSEIAETLGVPLGTVLSRMRYAMMRLRRLVSE